MWCHYNSYIYDAEEFHRLTYVLKTRWKLNDVLVKKLTIFTTNSFDNPVAYLSGSMLYWLKSYFCKIKLNKMNHFWSTHLHFHTYVTKTHSNRSSVLLLTEWTPYPIDSVSRKKILSPYPAKYYPQITQLYYIPIFSLNKTKMDKIKFCHDNEEFTRKFRHMKYHQYSDKYPAK